MHTFKGYGTPSSLDSILWSIYKTTLHFLNFTKYTFDIRWCTPLEAIIAELTKTFIRSIYLLLFFNILYKISFPKNLIQITSKMNFGVETKFLYINLLGSLINRGNHSKPRFIQNTDERFTLPA